jgi:hypothetical protein
MVLTASFHNRRLLKQKVKAFAKHRLVSVENEIMDERNRLQIDIAKWRQEQVHHMQEVADILLSHVPTDEPENQVLYLPSDFSNAETRVRLQIDRLAQFEMRLREGEAYDALRDVRVAVKHLNGLTYKKQLQVRDAGPNTRALNIINDVKKRRDGHIGKYNAARDAMISLGCTQIGNDDEFPQLTPADAVMKYTERPHALGDGSKAMAKIWRTGGKAKVPLSKEAIGMPILYSPRMTLICVKLPLQDLRASIINSLQKKTAGYGGLDQVARSRMQKLKNGIEQASRL